MINYTCVICEEQHPFDYMHLIDDRLVCNQCHWNALWNTKEIREFKKRNDPRKPVLDLIDSLQGEVKCAAGHDFYDNIYCAMEVRDILTEIQQAIYDMEV